MANSGFKINDAGDVELKLDEKHTLIIHRSDEGIVLDVWPEEDAFNGSIWSTYFFDSDMLPEEVGPPLKFHCRTCGHDLHLQSDHCPNCGKPMTDEP